MTWLGRHVVTIITVLVLGASIGIVSVDSASTTNSGSKCSSELPPPPAGATIVSCFTGPGVYQIQP